MNSKKIKDTISFLFNYSLPEDQKPIQEYIEAKKNTYFKIVFYSSKRYFLILFIFFSFFFFLSLCFFSFLKKKILINYIFSSFSFSFFFCFLFSSFLFLRWWEINYYFEKSYLFYEESSWFNSQFWEKPFFLLKYDNLVSFQRTRFLLRRLFLSLLYLSIAFLFTIIINFIIRSPF